jgi:4-hydroxybenzoate polyprenyltransferase
MRPIPWKALAQLVRLPNIFTAFADIGLGWLACLAAGSPWDRWPTFLLLMAASGCLYSAGMVWNDFFDLERDLEERPFRPIPSGRIERRHAFVIGATLLLFGAAFAALASGQAPGALLIACLLIFFILVYDGWLQRTPLGPIGMGSCRFLNVLLGLSVATDEQLPWTSRIYLAGVVGIYIVGVTWLARTEAGKSERRSLIGAGGVMLASLAGALAVPVIVDHARTSWLFPYLLVALGFFVGFPAFKAIDQPKPAHVQRAVKQAIFGLIMLDAVLAIGIAGSIGLILLLLLLPAMYLGRYIYST